MFNCFFDNYSPSENYSHSQIQEIIKSRSVLVGLVVGWLGLVGGLVGSDQDKILKSKRNRPKRQAFSGPISHFLASKRAL